MNNFNDVKFKWTFRSYQQKVLDNWNKHFKDKKFHIVAAPGSGKTILGLEIIRRINSPCIIFSPTTTIRDQWGQRFVEAFMPDNKKESDYISYNLKSVKLLTSITYQALYSTIEKVEVSSEDEIVDYSSCDIFKIINEYGIKTICLDEAHHLQNEWQKSLTKFINTIGKEVNVISLTATPPYDAGKIEWSRYISTCGPIDDEIFVPELVKEKTLCPHQDFIYFNYPTKEELQSLTSYKKKALEALENAKNLPLFLNIEKAIKKYTETENEFLFENSNDIASVISLLRKYKIKINEKLFYKVVGKINIPECSIITATIALQFLISNENFLSKEDRENLKNYLKSYGVIEKGIVYLDINEELKKILITSVGKLESIKKIAKCENNALENKLKMLILTDYIKKEKLVDIGTNSNLTNISIVSIFETLRRDNNNYKLACLSGSLVIMENNIQNKLKQFANISYKIKPLQNTNYSIYDFKCSNKEKVSIVSKLFEEGYFNFLIGTRSLLGEGWDSPCINSLIISSFVGSFMLSNQMRGRAIRVYKKEKNKVANIWHLITIEPELSIDTDLNNIDVDKINNLSFDKINSSDYKTLKRRFNCFVGPSFNENVIKSGIERIDIIKGPYSLKQFEEINKQMENFAINREQTKEKWEISLNSKKSQLVLQVEIPKTLKMPNVIWFKKSVKKISKCILKTFIKQKKISPKAKLKCETNKSNGSVSVCLLKATNREQNIFSTSIKEFLDKIDTPRYIIVKQRFKKFLKCKISFACPNLIGENKESVAILDTYLHKYLGDFVLIYTKNEKGKRILEKCKRESYVMKTQDEPETNQRVIN